MSGAAAVSGCRARTLDARRRAVERAIQLMRERLGEPLSLAAVARVAASSPYHFNRIFRQITGVPPFRFLAALRLEEAKRLLLTTGYSATAICFEVGYNSVGSFSRHFSESVGIPPSRLRRLAVAGAPDPSDGEGTEEGLAGAGISGRVEAPDGFTGAIFVGVFSSPLPSGRPSACALLHEAGAFRTSRVPDGVYHVFAAGIPVTVAASPAQALLHEDALRAGASPVEVRGGEAPQDLELVLRPRIPVDPPILVSLPVLLTERLSRGADAAGAGRYLPQSPKTGV